MLNESDFTPQRTDKFTPQQVWGLESKMKKWMKVGPVLSAYKRVKGKSRGPTPYGTTSLAESFAESFALYRVDPNALRRVMPKVYRWFKSGDHIKLARSKP